MGIEWKTLKEWNSQGYKVKKGHHAAKRDKNGVPLFDSWQVYRAKSGSYGEHPDPWVDYEDGIWGPEDEVAMDYS